MIFPISSISFVDACSNIGIIELCMSRNIKKSGENRCLTGRCDMKSDVKKGFLEVYGKISEHFFFAPGRVNIIGEHVDYNGGLVMPCALNMGSYVAASKRSDNKIRLTSMTYKPSVETGQECLDIDETHGWANYPKAVAMCFLEDGYGFSGFDMYFAGDLPRGAGLSSSASLCMAVAFSLNSMFALGLSSAELAKICQRAENKNGVNCGIMDPFASAACIKGHAILLDCAKLKYSQVPLDIGDWKIVIANTNKQRGLQESKYNERRAECEKALGELKKVVQVSELCDLSPDEFLAHKDVISCEVSRRRAQHVIFENNRAKKAAEFAKQGQWSEFSRILGEAHASLRDLYEVSCDELDSLVKHAYAFNGKHPIYGARMTGAGFGGCTVNIVNKNDIPAFCKYVSELYTRDCGKEVSFYEAEPDDGAREI